MSRLIPLYAIIFPYIFHAIMEINRTNSNFNILIVLMYAFKTYITMNKSENAAIKAINMDLMSPDLDLDYFRMFIYMV